MPSVVSLLFSLNLENNMIDQIANKYIHKFTIANEMGGAKEITIYKLPAKEGLSMGLQLSKTIIPVLASAMDGLRHDEYLHGAPKTFSEISLLLLQQIEKVEVEQLILRLTRGMLVDGKEIDFDTYFMANYGELIEVVQKALEVNFKSFFTANGLAAKFKGILSKVSASIDTE